MKIMVKKEKTAYYDCNNRLKGYETEVCIFDEEYRKIEYFLLEQDIFSDYKSYSVDRVKIQGKEFDPDYLAGLRTSKWHYI